MDIKKIVEEASKLNERFFGATEETGNDAYDDPSSPMAEESQEDEEEEIMVMMAMIRNHAISSMQLIALLLKPEHKSKLIEMYGADVEAMLLEQQDQLDKVADFFDEKEEEPTEEPAEEPTEEPAEEPTEEPTEEPAEEPTEEPTEEPAEEPTEEPAEEPEA